MGLGPTREIFEHWAIERMSGGTGLYPLPENTIADAVWLGFPVENPTQPVAIFQMQGKTVEVVEFRISIVAATDRTNYQDGSSPEESP